HIRIIPRWCDSVSDSLFDSGSHTRYKRQMRSSAVALLVATSAAVMPGLAHAAPPTTGPVTISPAPGTPDASPRTQISILGVGRSQIRSVTVRGSSSGSHAGRLRGYRGVRG